MPVSRPPCGGLLERGVGTFALDTALIPKRQGSHKEMQGSLSYLQTSTSLGGPSSVNRYSSAQNPATVFSESKKFLTRPTGHVSLTCSLLGLQPSRSRPWPPCRPTTMAAYSHPRASPGLSLPAVPPSLRAGVLTAGACDSSLPVPSPCSPGSLYPALRAVVRIQ